MADNKKRLSKFMSLVLRHQPEVAGLKLDTRGFCSIDSMLKAAKNHLRQDVTREDLEELSTPSDDPQEKTRFEIEGDYIRAGHGHSIPITGYPSCLPDKPLYHASPRTVYKDIQTSGLKSMSRQKVHLSYDKAITLEAARRRSRDVILIEIKVSEALAAGIGFYTSADPRIILSDEILAQFLIFHLEYQRG